jgi:hypothetical protein
MPVYPGAPESRPQNQILESSQDTKSAPSATAAARSVKTRPGSGTHAPRYVGQHRGDVLSQP